MSRFLPRFRLELRPPKSSKREEQVWSQVLGILFCQSTGERRHAAAIGHGPNQGLEIWRRWRVLFCSTLVGNALEVGLMGWAKAAKIVFFKLSGRTGGLAAFLFWLAHPLLYKKDKFGTCTLEERGRLWIDEAWFFPVTFYQITVLAGEKKAWLQKVILFLPLCHIRCFPSLSFLLTFHGILSAVLLLVRRTLCWPSECHWS